MNLSAQVALDSSSETPLYRQLADTIRGAILSGVLGNGERLPATRELAGQLGLNRTTVSAAYALLEEDGLLQGAVGRGSFVSLGAMPAPAALNWRALLPPATPSPAFSVPPLAEGGVNFASSRPAEECFPLSQFRRLTREVIEGPQAVEILQLGSPFGYAPLRRHLLAEAASEGAARPDDDLIVTNGCQQALDLLARVLVKDGATVLLEDPVYHGLVRAFGRAGAQLHGVPVGEGGLDLAALETLVAQHRPRLLVVTPDFQNPTGVSLPLESRRALIALAQRAGMALIEIQIYRKLRYRGATLPTLKQLDETGHVVAIGSFSKIAFPGLRVGWITGPRAVVARLAEAKQTSDLHSDQLSQAVLLRFAESGELARHIEATRRAGLERLTMALDACRRAFPPGTLYTRPDGGMNLWLQLPEPLVIADLLKAAHARGVSFLPGSYFSTQRDGHRQALRLSFGGLTPHDIGRGIEKLGAVAAEQLQSWSRESFDDRSVAIV